jgi:hemerythrin-like domain-containing protein
MRNSIVAISQETIQQFIEFIKLKVFDDGYIDRQEEKAILEEGVKRGIGVESGIAVIRQVCTDHGYALERMIDERAKEVLHRFANDGQVDKKEFDDAVALYKSDCKGKVKEDDIRKRLKQIMLDNGWKAKEGGFFGTKWFSAI